MHADGRRFFPCISRISRLHSHRFDSGTAGALAAPVFTEGEGPEILRDELWIAEPGATSRVIQIWPIAVSIEWRDAPVKIKVNYDT